MRCVAKERSRSSASARSNSALNLVAVLEVSGQRMLTGVEHYLSRAILLAVMGKL